MTRFLDGPAAGVALTLRRAPLYLRVVRASRAGRFEWDALDQLDDAPRPGETPFAYRRVGKPGSGHLDYTEKGRRRGVWFAIAEYRVCEAQPDDATMRQTAAWRAWCLAEHAKSKTPTPKE